MAGRSVADVGGTVVACVLVATVLHLDAVRAALRPEETSPVLALAAAGVGTAAALLAILGARLTGDARPAWIGAALTLYCVIVLPWATVAADDTDVAHRAARLVTYLGALVVLVLAIRPPRRLGRWGGFGLLAVIGLLAVATLGLPDTPFLRALVQGPLVTLAVLGGWTAAAAAFVVIGHRLGSRARSRVGLGLVVLAVAQLYRVAATTGATDVTFAALRLLGLLIVLSGLAELTIRLLGSWEAQRWEQQEELSDAALHMERAAEMAAERDHELRNGLAGLAGITHLLSQDAGGEQQERLRHAVLAELGRLHGLLDGEEIDPEPPAGYLVEPVLSGLVALRPGVALALEPGLTARGDSAVLAQVVTNLLANCERHAPGSTVTVSGRAEGADVVVEVRDEGPGLPAGAEDAVLGRGVRDEAAGGSGLGLHISARLAASQGGTLAVTNGEPSGCVATVTVPAGPPGAGADRSPTVEQPSPGSPGLIIPISDSDRILS